MNLNWQALLVIGSMALSGGLVACDSSTTTPTTGESKSPEASVAPADTKSDTMKSPEASVSPETSVAPAASASPAAKGDAMKSPEASVAPAAKKNKNLSE